MLRSVNMFLYNSSQPQLNQLRIVSERPSSKAYRAFSVMAHDNTAQVAKTQVCSALHGAQTGSKKVRDGLHTLLHEQYRHRKITSRRTTSLTNSCKSFWCHGVSAAALTVPTAL